MSDLNETCHVTGLPHSWEMGAPFTYFCYDCGKQTGENARENPVPPSPEALEALRAGLKSALEEPVVDMGSFAEYARPDWPETWMAVACTIAERSYDPQLKVGAIIVAGDNTQVLALGYNGNYRGGPHVHESTEPGKSGFIHAEANALVKCDFNFPKHKHMYVTHSPCRDCAKLIINAEIARVVYRLPYRDTSGVDLLRSAGVEVFSLEEALEVA